MPFQVPKEISLNDIQLEFLDKQSLEKNVKRISLSSSIMIEMITILRYCLFNKNSTDQLQLAFDAMYAIYLRALYYQIEDVLLYSQSVLKVLKN